MLKFILLILIYKYGVGTNNAVSFKEGKDPAVEEARRDYEEKKRKVERLLAEIHEFEQKSGIKNKFDQAA